MFPDFSLIDTNLFTLPMLLPEDYVLLRDDTDLGTT
jgi:hypothetical protein